MNTKFIKIFYLFMLFALPFIPVEVSASTIKDTEQEILALTSEYEQKAAELKQKEIDQQETLAELEDIRAQKVQVQAEIAQTEQVIVETEAEIAHMEEVIPKMQEQADIILVATQHASDQNVLLNSIFNSEGAADIIQSVEAYSTLSQASGEVILELIETVEQLEATKVELEEKNLQLEVSQHKLALDEAYAEDMVAALSAQVQEAHNAVAESNIALQAKEDQLKNMQDAGCGENDIYGIDCGTLNSASSFLRPIDRGYVTNEFNGYNGVTGNSWGHKGIDMADGTSGTPIYPIAPGKVITVGTANEGKAEGNYVVLLHLYEGRNMTSSYLHMVSAPYVQQGQVVSVADPLGGIGTTGNSTGNHLHLGIFESQYYYVNAVNPRKYISFPETWEYFTGR